MDHDLCGELQYEAFWGSDLADETTLPLEFIESELRFSFYSEDINLLGLNEYSMKASLKGYFDYIPTAIATGNIIIFNPCEEPTGLIAAT